jgi:phage tail-like protein
MAETYYPPVSFYFAVKFAGVTSKADSAFAEADGLQSELGVMEIKEGGENRYSHRVPDRAKPGKLTLKRGVMLASSELAAWCKNSLESDFSERWKPKNIEVSLLNEDGNPVLVWSFFGAWPVKWSVAGLDSKKNEVALETLEFVYAYCTREKEKDLDLSELFG